MSLSSVFILLLILLALLDLALLSLFVSLRLLSHMLCAFCSLLAMPTSLLFLFVNCLSPPPLDGLTFHLF